MSVDSLFFHNLRAPLARARTYGKLLLEESQDSDLLQQLLRALEDLERQILAAEENNESSP